MSQQSRRSFLLQSGALMTGACCGASNAFGFVDKSIASELSFLPCGAKAELTVSDFIDEVSRNPALADTVPDHTQKEVEAFVREVSKLPTNRGPQRTKELHDFVQQQKFVAEGDSELPDRSRLALLRSKRWKKSANDRVTVSLARSSQPGDRIEQAVKSAIKQWNEHIPFEMEFIGLATTADIRIFRLSSGRDSGNWSTIGFGGAGTNATMNLDPRDTQNRGPKAEGVALHELGHTLGAIHEHLQPNANISWIRSKVFEYYRKGQGWSDKDINDNLFKGYHKSELFFSKFDRNSIMIYAIPREVVRRAEDAVEWNGTLTLTDKNSMRKFYGMSPLEGGSEEGEGGDDVETLEETSARTRLKESDAVALTLNETVSKTFTDSKEYHLYKATPQSSGKYVFTTVEETPMDVTIELFESGPFAKDRAKAVSTIGSGERLLNAYLSHELNSGKTYYILVRPTYYAGKGTYQLKYREHGGDDEMSGFQRKVVKIQARQKETSKLNDELKTKNEKNKEDIEKILKQLGGD